MHSPAVEPSIKNPSHFHAAAVDESKSLETTRSKSKNEANKNDPHGVQTPVTLSNVTNARGIKRQSLAGEPLKTVVQNK
jgi:hypothetical protein